MSKPIDLRKTPLSPIDSVYLNKDYAHHLKGILATNGYIDIRVKKLAAEISADYRGDDLVVVAVMDGALGFLYNLVTNCQLPVTIDTMTVKSYEGTESTGNIEIIKDISLNMEGKHLLLIEDILDTGNTLSALIPELKKKNPASLEVAVLFDKVEKREKEVGVKYTGFIIPDEFVVGYFLDFNNKYRDLPHLAILKEERYK